MLKTIWQSVRATLVLALITGIIFPLAITAVAQLAFPNQANGSLIKDQKGKVIGSALLGQQFAKPAYFHPRPSAAGGGYAGEASSGTNLGPTSRKLFEGQADDPATKNVDESFAGVKQLADDYRKENGLPETFQVPIDAVTRSGSGLDPDISLENARVQAARVAAARQIPVQIVRDAIKHNTTARQLGFLGEARVNVLSLNLFLDRKSD